MKRKVSDYFKKRKYMFLIVFTALCAGMVAGAFSAVNTGAESGVGINSITGKDVIILSFSENAKFLMWIALWGVNMVGFPVIIYLLYAKGTSLSAAICTLMIKDSSSGIVLLLSAIPYLACTIASVMVLSQGSLNCSLGLLKSMVMVRRNNKRTAENIVTMMLEFIPSMLLVLIGGVCETLLKVNIV